MLADPLTHWDTLDQAERDLCYNNTAAVPDSARLNAERIAASKAYRAAHPGHLDLAYGPAERNRWDLFPAPKPDAPCLVFIHGGYWQWNRRQDFCSLAEGPAALGWSVALPGYTLAPDASLEQIVGEIWTALDWLAAHGPRHGIAGPIFICGWSAGAHLAATALGHKAVAAGLAVSGVYELGPLRDTWLNAALSLTDDQIAALSPLRTAAIAKPLAIAYGENELPRLVADSCNFHAWRTSAGAFGPLIPVPNADHFTVLEQLRQPDGLLSQALRDLAQGFRSLRSL